MPLTKYAYITSGTYDGGVRGTLSLVYCDSELQKSRIDKVLKYTKGLSPRFLTRFTVDELTYYLLRLESREVRNRFLS